MDTHRWAPDNDEIILSALDERALRRTRFDTWKELKATGRKRCLSKGWNYVLAHLK